MSNKLTKKNIFCPMFLLLCFSFFLRRKREQLRHKLLSINCSFYCPPLNYYRSKLKNEARIKNIEGFLYAIFFLAFHGFQGVKIISDDRIKVKGVIYFIYDCRNGVKNILNEHTKIVWVIKILKQKIC